MFTITRIRSLYRIKKELDQYGKKYSYQQIRDALDVLSSMTYFIQGKELNEEGKMTVSPIQYSYYNPNTDKDKQGAKAKLKINLNELVTQDILQRKWRQVGYKNIMQDRSFLGRYLRERLYLRYIQASPTEPYSFMVSSLVFTE